MASADVVFSLCLLIFCQLSLADRTCECHDAPLNASSLSPLTLSLTHFTLTHNFFFLVNNPECSDVAFAGDDKFITCPLPDADVTATTAPTGCDDLSLTNDTLTLLRWCIFYNEVQCCFTRDNATQCHEDLSITSAGQLHISLVSLNFKHSEFRNNINCSLLSAQGAVCSQQRLEILIFVMQGRSS